MLPFERFDAWKACHALAVAIHRRTKSFPKDERFELTAQIRRAAFSAPANIAEGSAKRGRAEMRRFLDITLGSLSEVGYALIFARDVGILDPAEWSRLDTMRDEAGRLTWRLYESLGRRGEGGKAVGR